jgi:hypothetical protein
MAKILEVLKDYVFGGAIGRCDFSPLHLFLRLGNNRGHSWVRRRGSDEGFHLIDGRLSQMMTWWRWRRLKVITLLKARL